MDVFIIASAKEQQGWNEQARSLCREHQKDRIFVLTPASDPVVIHDRATVDLEHPMTMYTYDSKRFDAVLQVMSSHRPSWVLALGSSPLMARAAIVRACDSIVGTDKLMGDACGHRYVLWTPGAVQVAQSFLKTTQVVANEWCEWSKAVSRAAGLTVLPMYCPARVDDMTFVTCFFDIRKREAKAGAEEGKVKKRQDYLVHGQKLLRWDVNLFLFVEPDMVAHIFAERKKLGLLHKTMLCPTTIEQSRYFPLLGQVQTMFSEGKIPAGSNPTKDTALYVWCTMAKADALRRAMEINVFQSEKFFWIDFGLSHVAQDPKPSLDYLLSQLANSHHDRVRVHNLRAFTPEETHDSRKFYSRLDQCVAGGFFGGSLRAMRWFVDEWEAEMHESLKSFPTLEQGLFARIWSRHPARFQTVEAYVDGHGRLLQPRSNELLLGLIQDATEKRDWPSVDSLATEFVPHPFAGEWKDRDLQAKVCDVLVKAKRCTASTKIVTSPTPEAPLAPLVAAATTAGAAATTAEAAATTAKASALIPFFCLSKPNSERRRKMEKRFQMTGVPCRFVDPDEISNVQVRIDSIFAKEEAKAPASFDYRMTAIMNNHLKMVQTFLNETKAPYGVFCEDDIHLSLSLKHDVRHLCSIQSAQNAALFLLGYLDPVRKPITKGSFTLTSFDDHTWGAQMYMISRAYAEELLKTFTLEWAIHHPHLPYNPDWIITKPKDKNRMTAYPMLAVEEGVIDNKSDPGQVEFHSRCFLAQYDSTRYTPLALGL